MDVHVSNEGNRRVMRVLCRERIHIFRAEILNPEAKLDKALGIRLRLAPAVLDATVMDLVISGKLVAFRMNGDIAFLPEKIWQEWLKDEPEMELVRVSPYSSDISGEDTLYATEEHLGYPPQDTDRESPNEEPSEHRPIPLKEAVVPQ